MRLSGIVAAVFTFVFAGSYTQAGAAGVSPFYVDMTQISPTELEVSVSFPDFSFNGTITGPGGSWTILQEQSYNNGNPVDSSWHDGCCSYYATDEIAWLEPDGDPSNPTYNLLTFGYDPSGPSAGEHIYAISGQTVADLDDNYNFYTNCYYGGGAAPCPSLNNGQTLTLPLYYTYSYPSVFVGNMDVTFTDNAGVPEPGTFLMLGTGLLGLGGTFRRKFFW
jgi:hypothetical protein